jgi:hypothetical protein
LFFTIVRGPVKLQSALLYAVHAECFIAFVEDDLLFLIGIGRAAPVEELNFVCGQILKGAVLVRRALITIYLADSHVPVSLSSNLPEFAALCPVLFH